eukprot:7865749-Pyramimonas_sp.AAC.1
MTTAKHAFDGSTLPAVVMKIIRGVYDPLPDSYSASLRELVAALLQRQPLVSQLRVTLTNSAQNAPQAC